jgi:hypothetical protein
MRFEERKLRLIQQCMELADEEDLRKAEEAMEIVKLDRRARASEADIEAGRVNDFHQFNADMKQWIKEKRRMA